jgi:hypothetical protein
MDEHQNNDLDNLFRGSLRFYKEKPSGSLWTKIEDNLDKEDRSAYIARRGKRILIAASLLLILTGIGIYSSLTVHHIKTLAGQTKKAGIDHPGSSSKIQQFNKSTSVNNVVLTNEMDIHHNHPLTEYQIRFLRSGNPDINLLQNTGENEQPLISTQTLESGISSIQPVSTDDLSQRASSEKLIVMPKNKSLSNKLSLTAFFSQEFAGYNLSDDDATAADGREIEQRERNAFSASMGFYLNYRINKRWTIQSGLSYSWSTSNIDSATSYAVKDNSGNVQFKMNTISGYGYLQSPPSLPPSVGDSVLTGKSYSRIHYLTVPLVLSYRIPLNRFSLLVGAGLSFNLLTNAYLETEIYGPNLREASTTTPINGLKKLYYGVILKADLEYQISKKLGINLIPSFKNSLSPINIHSALSAYPYNIGLGLGMSYLF